MSAPKVKITYSTLSADNTELNTAYEAAVVRVKSEFGQTFPLLIGGQERRRDLDFPQRQPYRYRSSARLFPERRGAGRA